MTNNKALQEKKAQNRDTKNRTILFSVGTAFSLMVVKIIVGLSTGSLSLLASAVDSLSDLFISSSNVYILRKAEEKPTENFRYGLGKLEGLAGLFQGFVIMGMGGFLIYESVLAIMSKAAPSRPWDVIFVMAISMVATFFLSRFLKRQAKKTNSLALEADAAHYEVDLLSNAGILIGFFFLVATGQPILDAVISLIVSVLIILDGGKIVIKSAGNLLDREVSLEMQEQIIKIFETAKEKSKISGFHFLRTRQSGSKIFLDAHIVFEPETLLLTAHKISHEIENTLQRDFQNIEVLLHFDPVDDSQDDRERKW